MSMSLTGKIISCVKDRPILYDLNHVHYKDVRKRNKVWKEIGILLNQNRDEVKKKWKNIKDCYQKHLRTINDKTGSISKRSYKNWHWARVMEFYRPHWESTIASSKKTRSEAETDAGPQSKRESESFEDASGDNSAQDTFSYNPTYQRSERDSTSMEHFQSSIQDATDLIFLGYSKTIKKFSARRQAIVKMRIAQVIMEEELNNLEEAPTLEPQEAVSSNSQLCTSTFGTEFPLKIEEKEEY